MMCKPTSMEPVKATIAVRGSLTSASADGLSSPRRSWITPLETQPLDRLHQSLAMALLCSAGFIKTVLPTTAAAAVIPVKIASGFHGAITTATPRAWLIELDSPGTCACSGVVVCSASACRA